MVAAELGQHLMAIYDKVVVDVLRRASRKLEDDGLHVEESLLAELQASWETKMIESGALMIPADAEVKPKSRERGGGTGKAVSEVAAMIPGSEDPSLTPLRPKAKANGKKRDREDAGAEASGAGGPAEPEAQKRKVDEFGDSDSDLSDLSDEEDEETDNTLFGLYDKVTRTKGRVERQKANLRNVVINLNGRDFIVQSGTAHFDWA